MSSTQSSRHNLTGPTVLLGVFTAVGGVAAAAALGLPALAIGAVALPGYAVGHGIGWLVGRRTASTPAAAPTTVDTDANTLADLASFQTAIQGRVPAAVAARVARIASRVSDTIPRLANLGPMNAQAHAVLRTATTYLPEAVAGYLRLPRDFADNRPVENGKTSLVVLCDQLDILAVTMDKVYDAVCRADADALIAHGKFLEEKFGAGSLTIAPQLNTAPQAVPVPAPSASDLTTSTTPVTPASPQGSK